MSYQSKCKACHTLLMSPLGWKYGLCAKCERKSRGLPEIPKCIHCGKDCTDDELSAKGEDVVRKVLVAQIYLRRDGSTWWQIITPSSAKLLSGGGTRRGKNAPKNAITIACRSVEEALKRGGQPSIRIGRVK